MGTTFSFSLNQPATITLTFTQSAAGRRVSGKCVARTKSDKHEPRCSRTLTAGSVNLSAATGVDRIYFDGLLSRKKKLKLGRYEVRITAVNSAGRRTTSSSLGFTIVD